MKKKKRKEGKEKLYLKKNTLLTLKSGEDYKTRTRTRTGRSRQYTRTRTGRSRQYTRARISTLI